MELKQDENGMYVGMYPLRLPHTACGTYFLLKLGYDDLRTAIEQCISRLSFSQHMNRHHSSFAEQPLSPHTIIAATNPTCLKL